MIARTCQRGGVIVKEWYELVFGVMELFYSLSVEVVTQTYTCVNSRNFTAPHPQQAKFTI